MEVVELRKIMQSCGNNLILTQKRNFSLRKGKKELEVLLFCIHNAHFNCTIPLS